MKLFGGKKGSESSWGGPVPGLADLAASRGWQEVDAEPAIGKLADQVHRLAWILQEREYLTGAYDTNSIRQSTVYKNAYGGESGGHPFVVANAWTNVGPQQVFKLYEMTGMAICVVQRCKLPPLEIQPSDLPQIEHVVKPTPTGDPEFDAKFMTKTPLPGTEALMTDDVRRRILAHRDWAFVALSGALLCASPDPYQSGYGVGARLDEVLGLVEAFTAAAVPTSADPETAALLDRVAEISNLDDALALLLGLTAHERELLAKSDTPLAAFAQVTTADQALATLQSLDFTERLRLFAMLNIEQ